MRLVLVRHAEPADDARGRCYGSLDVDLSAGGRAQSTKLAELLAAERVAAVVSSPRRRAVDTARAIATAHNLDVTILDGLRELDFGELEGRSYDEIATSQPELFEQWMRAPTTVRFPGGEAYDDLRARTLEAVSGLRQMYGGDLVVAVTHGGVIRAVLAEVLGMPAEHIFRLAVDTASLTRVDWIERVPIVCYTNVRA